MMSCVLWLTLAALSFASQPDGAAVPDSSNSTASSSPLPAVSPARVLELAKAVEIQEKRHYSIHKFYIPATQGNLQWISNVVRAKPEESLVLWKLLRKWHEGGGIRDTAPALD